MEETVEISGLVKQLELVKNYQTMVIICVGSYIYKHTTNSSHWSVFPCFATITNR